MALGYIPQAKNFCCLLLFKNWWPEGIPLHSGQFSLSPDLSKNFNQAPNPCRAESAARQLSKTALLAVLQHPRHPHCLQGSCNSLLKGLRENLWCRTGTSGVLQARQCASCWGGDDALGGSPVTNGWQQHAQKLQTCKDVDMGSFRPDFCFLPPSGSLLPCS